MVNHATYCTKDHPEGPCSSPPTNVAGVDTWRCGDHVFLDAPTVMLDKTAWGQLRDVVEGLWAVG